MKLMQFLLAFGLLAAPVFAQESEPAHGDQAAEMQAWMEFMTPGENHANQEKWVGEFTVSTKHWMQPGAEPILSEGGKMVNTSMMGGRYLMSKHTSTFMGMPFEGLNIQGYDNAKKKFVSVWVDNHGTGLMIAEGNFDENGVLTLGGMMSSPMGEIPVREVITFEGTDKQHMEMFMSMGEQEMKVMEIDMVRVVTN